MWASSEGALLGCDRGRLELEGVVKFVQQLPTLAVSPPADAVSGEREPDRNDSEN
jgi:hypothetical protein